MDDSIDMPTNGPAARSNPAKSSAMPAPTITPASLEFVKSTVAEKGIDPELGIVHYRNGQGKGAKRKWGVQGIQV